LAEISKKSQTAMALIGAFRIGGSRAMSAGDKIYCVHEAESEDVIRRTLASRRAFPVNAVAVVANEFGPQTAESRRQLTQWA